MSNSGTGTPSQRRAAFLAAAFLDSLSDSGSVSDSDSLLIAVEAIETAFGFSVSDDAADINPDGASLLDLVGEVAAESAADAEGVEEKENRSIPGLATLRKQEKFQKFLASVETNHNVFGSFERGSDEHIKRLGLVVKKFLTAFPNALNEGATSADASSASAKSEDGAVPGGPEATAKADELKAQGNALLKQKDFRGAVKVYTQAISTDPQGPNAHVYFSNRAAARQHLRDYRGAADDCRSSVRLNPTYVKGFLRLAQACEQLKEWNEVVDACEAALKVDETSVNASMMLAKAKRAIAAGDVAKTSVEQAAPAAAQPTGGAPGGFDLNAMMGALGGNPGGGMPDLSAMMSNPMVQNAMNSMMQNPDMMKNVMQAAGSMLGGNNNGGGMPDMSQMAAMAQQMGLGGAPGGNPAQDVQDGDGDAEPVVEEVN